MKFPRLLHASLKADDRVVALTGDVRDHIRAFRLKKGDGICLFDGLGNEADARVLDVSGKECRCEIVEYRRAKAAGEGDVRVTLVQALPKWPKVETVVRMATELGVDSVRLALSDRTVPDVSRAQLGRRLERLAKIAEEAVAVAGRSKLPTIVAPAPLAAVVAETPADALRLTFWEESTEPLDSAVAAQRVRRTSGDAWVVIGPEGGLSAAEVTLLESQGFAACTLGPSVLRVDTAAVTALAVVFHELRGNPVRHALTGAGS